MSYVGSRAASNENYSSELMPSVVLGATIPSLRVASLIIRENAKSIPEYLTTLSTD